MEVSTEREFRPTKDDWALEAAIRAVRQRHQSFVSPTLKRQCVREHDRLVALRSREMQEYIEKNGEPNG